MTSILILSYSLFDTLIVRIRKINSTWNIKKIMTRKMSLDKVYTLDFLSTTIHFTDHRDHLLIMCKWILFFSVFSIEVIAHTRTDGDPIDVCFRFDDLTIYDLTFRINVWYCYLLGEDLSFTTIVSFTAILNLKTFWTKTAKTYIWYFS